MMQYGDMTNYTAADFTIAIPPGSQRAACSKDDIETVPSANGMLSVFPLNGDTGTITSKNK